MENTQPAVVSRSDRYKRHFLVGAGVALLLATASAAFLFASQSLALICGLVAGYAACRFRSAAPRAALAASELALQRFAKGDYSVRVCDDGKNIPTSLACAINDLAEVLRDKSAQLSAARERLGGVSQQITLCAREAVSQMGREQEPLAEAVCELTASVDEVASSSTQATEASMQADRQADQGKVAMTEAIGSMDALSGELGSARAAMQQLDEYIEGIGGVLGVIRGIAEQTNMLALNAAIEAARAGEQGRGFAVVADEVRNLAGRTQHSTREIQRMIERVQSGAGEVVDLVVEGDNQAKVCEELIETACISLAGIAGEISSIKALNSRIDGFTGRQRQAVASLGEVVAAKDAGNGRQAKQTELTTLVQQLEQMVEELRV